MVEVDIGHCREHVLVGFNHRGFEAVHDDLTAPFQALVDCPRKLAVYDPEEVRESFLVFEMTGKVRMVVHEAVGMNLDPIFILIFEEQVVIGAFCPFPLKEPVFVVALPRDVEARIVAYDLISWQISHAS